MLIESLFNLINNLDFRNSIHSFSVTIFYIFLTILCIYLPAFVNTLFILYASTFPSIGLSLLALVLLRGTRLCRPASDIMARFLSVFYTFTISTHLLISMLLFSGICQAEIWACLSLCSSIS